ncbi:anti-sigma factor antagonist [Streptomyces lunaelactis]|uniref:anti-sigma factor antagonist n=1 Tax=Streptomyces lunaelactis TaxID=1535768 RepID=UPI001584E989|nr:anti-sigma factor antagonist [Streptomyces lunaelactis]NUK04447.1 anti-sigma factor antagonist [Streptomyces lunaelactis]NUK11225.1 anti-sigma factor antagonist [Streptomyces lunaelactis]NUK16573.1 anti-sigma factor antagonist [Streptomyces lunaelactis]NUK27578.1 anti-sigma factor antagonist [Streptomyces lunaelactis]NUK35133.1 anti-sigma factor antagonist [Streptomyces lunaelactis]
MTEGLTSRSSDLHAPLPGPYGQVYRCRERTVVELHGEIDIAAATLIGAYVDVVTAVRAQEVVIDLTQVEFFDCSGLALLCRAARRTAEVGGRLWVVCDRHSILRVFRAGGVLGVFRTLPTLDEALAAARD